MGEKIQDPLNSIFENRYFFKSLQLQRAMQFNLYKKKLSSPCEENLRTSISILSRRAALCIVKNKKEFTCLHLRIFDTCR